MATTSAAAIIRAAIASLQAGLPAKVAAFNADSANLVDIELPQSWWFGGQDLLTAFQFPQVEVALIDGQLGRFALENADVDHYPQINVVVWLQGASGEIPTLLEQSYGLGFACRDVLLKPAAFGAGVEIVNEPGAVFYSQDVVPADPTEEEIRARRFKHWRTAFFLRFRLDLVDTLG